MDLDSEDIEKYNGTTRCIHIIRGCYSVGFGGVCVGECLFYRAKHCGKYDVPVFF